MAKFCGNCGAELEGNERVCGMCGKPIVGAQEIHGSDLQRKPVNKQKIKKVMKTVIAIAIVVAVGVAALKIVPNFVGGRGLVRQVMSAYKTYDIDTLVTLSSDVYYYGGEDEAELYFEYAVGEAIDYFEDMVGHSYRLTYEINEIYTMSDRKTDILLNDLEYAYPSFDFNTISKVAVADVLLTAKQGKNETEYAVPITMTKEGNTWKLLYLDYYW